MHYQIGDRLEIGLELWLQTHCMSDSGAKYSPNGGLRQSEYHLAIPAIE